MKINIAPRQQFLREGYVHPNADAPIAEMVLAGEASELIAPAIEYVEQEKLSTYLDNLVSRVVPGGFVGFGATDLSEVSIRAVNGQITYREAAKILFGDGQKDAFTLERLCEELEKRGVKVTRRSRENMRCWASGIRN